LLGGRYLDGAVVFLDAAGETLDGVRVVVVGDLRNHSKLSSTSLTYLFPIKTSFEMVGFTKI
jgi:hypothetical protein